MKSITYIPGVELGRNPDVMLSLPSWKLYTLRALAKGLCRTRIEVNPSFSDQPWADRQHIRNQAS
jgi:hypothetical protein